MILEGSVHEFYGELRAKGGSVRAVGFARGAPPVLCVFSGADASGAGRSTFDARALAGKRVLVRDAGLAAVALSLFASFNPPVRPPEIVESGRHEARCVRASQDGAQADLATDASVADFSGASREIFRVLRPELLFENVVSSSLFSKTSPPDLSGPRVTTVALETVYWTAPSDPSDPPTSNEEIARFARANCDPRRMRELEVRFGARLHDASEEIARAADARFRRIEELVLAGGRAYVEAPGRGSVLVPPPGKLEDPKDYARGTMRVSLGDMEAVSRAQGVDVEPGAAFMFRVGSYPERAWYVHEVFGGEAVLAPWMPVALGRRADHLGVASDGRPVRAVVGQIDRVHGASPEPKPGVSVGDAKKGVFGELYETKGGSWAVLGARPNGFPALREEVRAAADASRAGSGGRFDYKCHGGAEQGLAATREACAESGGVWDRPCTRDHECPYFSSDARGGCVDGYCEMPLGVENSAFTVGTGAPVCLNCGPGSPDPVRCCDSLETPEYAWPDPRRP